MKNLYTCTREELKQFVISLHQPAFRANQIWEWLWKKNATSFYQMSNLPATLRSRLEQNFFIAELRISSVQQSSDGSRKYLFRFTDERAVEGVLIPSGDRVTACVSSQIGCPLQCRFCATGTMGFKRNLEFWEIYQQVAALNAESVQHYARPLSNIVYMGMGEPLLNYDNVAQSIALICSPDTFGMSPQRITVSTSGIIEGIKRWSEDTASTIYKVQLALSLHHADPIKRAELMPVTNSNRLFDLREALAQYNKQTHNRITIEYVLLAGVNDSIEDAQQLAAYCRRFPVKINLIEYNEVPLIPFRKSKPENMAAFKQFLESKNMVVNLRRSKGQDIAAACGQLANRQKQ